MADFKQVIKWLKEGKEVRRKSWEGKSTKGYKPHYSDWKYSIEEIEATDWEIYCENHVWLCNPKSNQCFIDGCEHEKHCSNCGVKKPEELKPLSDKIQDPRDPYSINRNGFIRTDDVKEKIQNAQKRLNKLINEVGMGGEVTSSTREIFEEEFGKELL